MKTGHFKIKFYLEELNSTLKSCKVQIQMFCDKHKLDLRMYDDFGWFFGRVDVVIEGDGTKNFIYSVKDAVESWLEQFREDN